MQPATRPEKPWIQGSKTKKARGGVGGCESGRPVGIGDGIKNGTHVFVNGPACGVEHTAAGIEVYGMDGAINNRSMKGCFPFYLSPKHASQTSFSRR